MSVFSKFVTGKHVNEYRAVGCQLNTPLTSGSFTGFQALANTIFPTSGDQIDAMATVWDGRFKEGGSTTWERPGGDEAP